MDTAMDNRQLTRDEIVSALEKAFLPLDWTHAMWQAGAIAFDRVDQWSDIDLQIDVDDDHVEETFAIVEKTLESLSPIDLKYRLPEPTWHGHSQAFYRLRGASPYLLLDLSVSRKSNPNKFIQPGIHGNAVVHFDRSGSTNYEPLDMTQLAGKLRSRLETLRLTFDLNRILTLKELHRGNIIEAISFYQGFVLRPLVEALRIRYAPTRHGFHTRYVQYDLPGDVVGTLESLFFVGSPDDLREKFDRAERLFRDTVEEIRLGEVQRTE
jgi:hypothetical protein